MVYHLAVPAFNPANSFITGIDDLAFAYLFVFTSKDLGPSASVSGKLDPFDVLAGPDLYSDDVLSLVASELKVLASVAAKLRGLMELSCAHVEEPEL